MFSCCCRIDWPRLVSALAAVRVAEADLPDWLSFEEGTRPPMSEPTSLKQASTRFQPGQSGNSLGRPQGARHAALVALDAIGADGAQDIMHAVVGAARQGDMRAADILLRRLWPERKGRPVLFDIPRIKTTSAVATAIGAVTNAVAAGEASPEEGAPMASILEAQRRAVETVELERRLTALEQGVGRCRRCLAD